MKVNLLAIMLVGIFLFSTMLVVAFEDTTTKEKSIAKLEIADVDIVDEESIQELVPSEKEVTTMIDRLRVPKRFILWTHDGKNVMWGKYGNGYFTGKDNNGKKAWGIYYDGSFAGYYDDHFFYGRYNDHRWKARGIFGMRSSYGGFKTFPFPRLTATAKTLPQPKLK